MPREKTPTTRQKQRIDRFKYIIIITEGEKKEPLYFQALKSFSTLSRDSRIQIKLHEKPKAQQHHSAPPYLVQFARESAQSIQLQDYDEIWIVFDTDTWPKKSLISLLDWQQESVNHYLAYSNPCFELWLLLHFDDYESIKQQIELVENHTKRSKKCKSLLNELIIKHQLSGNYIQYLCRIDNAIERAKTLDALYDNEFIEITENITTKIHLLVEKFFTLPQRNAIFNPEICHNEKEVETKFIASYLLPRLDYQASDWVQQPAFNRLRLDFLAHQLVIEAKKPNRSLDDSHVKQLTRYLQATQARYGLLTNAQELRVYEQINAEIRLVFRCFVKGIENSMFDLKKLIGKRVLSQNKTQDKIQDKAQDNAVEITQQIELETVDYSHQESSNMKIIGVYHNKGGVGKTTVSVNLAAALRNMGKRVLLIDIDAQSNATFATGLIKFLFDEDDDLIERNVFNLLEDAENGLIPDICHPSVNFNAPEIDVIASHITLIDKQSRITAFLNTRFRLHKKLQLVKNQYDIVIIDAPPSRDIYAEITLITADYLIIPSDLKPFANQGLPNVRNFIRQIDETRMSIGKSALQIIGVLPSKISSNVQYLRHTFQKQRKHIVDKYHFPVMESRIIDRKSLSDCFNQDIEDGELRIPDPKSIFMFGGSGSIESCEEFNLLAKEVLQKIGS